MTNSAPEFFIELDREIGGRWIAEVTNVPGAMAYGSSANEAIARAKAIALFALNHP